MNRKFIDVEQTIVRSVNDILVKQMRDTRKALEPVMNKDLQAFNALLRARGLKTIDVTLPAVVF